MINSKIVKERKKLAKKKKEELKKVKEGIKTLKAQGWDDKRIAETLKCREKTIRMLSK